MPTLEYKIPEHVASMPALHDGDGAVLLVLPQWIWERRLSVALPAIYFLKWSIVAILLAWITRGLMTTPAQTFWNPLVLLLAVPQIVFTASLVLAMLRDRFWGRLPNEVTLFNDRLSWRIHGVWGMRNRFVHVDQVHQISIEKFPFLFTSHPRYRLQIRFKSRRPVRLRFVTSDAEFPDRAMQSLCTHIERVRAGGWKRQA